MARTIRLEAPGTSRDRGRAALLGASLALHAAVLVPMALGLFNAEFVVPDIPAPPIQVEMEPRPLLRGEAARVPSPSASRTTAETAPLTGPVSSVVAPRPRDEDEDTPSVPTPRAAGAPVAGAPAPPAGANPWAFVPETMTSAVGRSLRTGPGGCRTMDGRLSAAEQALCDERFNDAAGRAGPLGRRTLTAAEERREAQFIEEGNRALAAYQSRRAPMRAGVGVSGAAPECPGGNLRGTCAGAYLPPHYQHGEEAPFGGTAAPK